MAAPHLAVALGVFGGLQLPDDAGQPLGEGVMDLPAIRWRSSSTPASRAWVISWAWSPAFSVSAERSSATVRLRR
ncbi:hypothetical protein ACFQ10_45075 [Streptomyces indonesiensis]